ncbi:MAG: HD-GYP domain-containing protein [Ruminococcaceae bacterium]|nr:HD-GYP domain-containing protein [Oscillospiraceae bacterium]
MMKQNRKKATALFAAIFAAGLLCMVLSAVKTNTFNNTRHESALSGPMLFAGEGEPGELSVRAAARSSTWGKVFDFNNAGLTENNYQAYTYDFSINNNTGDEVEQFRFQLNLGQEAYIASAWNGALEIHQDVAGGETVATVPDMREFDPALYELETVTVDGEALVTMHAGDYLIYYPSASQNAMEVPIGPHEGTTPGLILYVAIGESIEADSTLLLDYRFHRVLTSEPLFWVAVGILALWLVALVVYAITSAQIRKYQERHERDNEIINESIETFTGFIDAKDPYTNGHSKRVAIYTRCIAREMGISGEDLDRVYYIALLHDCGKIGVPDSILGKPGKLTDEEFEIIKSHTVRGGEILSHFKSLKNAGEGARYHHERYDGRGYPDGLKGEDIPFIARMICVADSYDAMNTNRVYRDRLSTERIIDELERNRGLQFDPQVADVMLGLLRAGALDEED